MKNNVNETVFKELSALLMKQVPPMVVSKKDSTGLELIGNVPVPYGSTKKIVPGMYFASLVVRKSGVSFYFFPLYWNPELIDLLPEGTRKRMTGKTCFSFRSMEELDMKAITALLKKGVALWKKSGFVA